MIDDPRDTDKDLLIVRRYFNIFALMGLEVEYKHLNGALDIRSKINGHLYTIRSPDRLTRRKYAEMTNAAHAQQFGRCREKGKIPWKDALLAIFVQGMAASIRQAEAREQRRRQPPSGDIRSRTWRCPNISEQDKAFLKTADHDICGYLVYSDWLEEQGRIVEARYYRETYGPKV